jgi:diguanylate cyclase (GGDEF)-like protein
VMPGTLPPEALVAAERLRVAIETMDCRAADGSRLALTVSIGVAHTGGQSTTAEDLVRHADGALYAAKRAGRNQVSQAVI